jgi:hypothetical protein
MRIGGIGVHPGGSASDLRFEAFIDRLRTFSRSSIARVGAHISWTIWRTPAPSPEPPDWYVCRAYMPLISALGVAVCDDSGDRKVPTESDMRALANDLLGVRSPISEERDRVAELEELRAALNGTASLSGVAPTDDSLRAVHGFISVARDLRAQWSFRSVTPTGILRAWATAQHLERRVPGFLERLAAQWNIGLRDLLRCCSGLLALGANDPKTLGAFALQSVGTEEVEPFGITLDALRLVASRLGQPPAYFFSWYRDVVLPCRDSHRKYVPHPLVREPLVTIDASLTKYQAPPHSYLCPSPAHLVWKTQSLVTDSARALGATWNPALKTEVGHALADVVREMLVGVCGRDSVVDLDAVFGPAAPTHADFAVLVGTTAIIIESKTSLGTAEGKSVITPAQYVASWQRIWEAFLQCVRTPRATEFKSDARLAHITDFVFFVTFEEQMCVEAAALNAVGVADGVYRAEGVSHAEAVTLQELEDALVVFGPTKLSEAVREKWRNGRHGDLLSAFLRGQQRPRRPFSDRGYAARYSEELFGSQRVLDAIRAADVGV